MSARLRYANQPVAEIVPDTQPQVFNSLNINDLLSKSRFGRPSPLAIHAQNNTRKSCGSACCCRPESERDRVRIPRTVSHQRTLSRSRQRHSEPDPLAWLARVGNPVRQAVGTVPPSITYSVPVMASARGDATNAMRSATSRGLAGRPIGMPPSDRMMISLPPA
jgi:hypothetical protein